MRWVLLTGFGVLTAALLVTGVAESQESAQDRVARIRQLVKQGDYRDAATLARRVALEQPATSDEIGKAFRLGLDALANVDGWPAVEAFRDAVVNRHSDTAEVLVIAAENLRRGPTHGTIVDGQFRRGEWGEQYIDVSDATRAQAIGWLVDALAIVGEDEALRLRTLQSLRDALRQGRTGSFAWRLQESTDYENVPDYADRDAHLRPGSQLGWPVDSDGKPVAYQSVRSWEAAKSDGERFRWTLDAIAKLRPRVRDNMVLAYADFLRQHLGVGTIGQVGWGSDDGSVGDDILSVRTLEDNETIARLTTGVRRLTLDPDLDYLAMFESIANERQRVDRLSSVYLDRMQYERAAETLVAFTQSGQTGGSLGERYRQITGSLGQLQPVESQPAGDSATLQYRFRNGKRVAIDARRVDFRELLSDWKAAISGAGAQSANDMQQWFGNPAAFLLQGSASEARQEKYLSTESVSWDVDLQPSANHFDRLVDVETPLREAGVYLVTAKMADGNVSRVIVWLDDLAIVRKPLAAENRYLYYVAETVTGKPVPGAQLTCFGWQNGERPREVKTRRVAMTTNPTGLVEQVLPERYQWLVAAEDQQGRTAFLNPEWLWSMGGHRSNQLSRTQSYGVTDRPIYRPGHEVKTHVWLRDARYDLEDQSNHAGKSGRLAILDPQGEEVAAESVTLDEYGGCGLEWTVASDAKLGRYHLRLYVGGRNYGAGQFRVEEYRKPDFEVSVEQPDGPVQLGDSVEVTVRANYYAGGPVSEGRVSIKVERTAYHDSFFPIQPWDWLYGNGYGWKPFEGYGRYRRGGWWRSNGPPELVSQLDVPLSADGTATLKVDTQLAKTLFGDQSQRYQITAEVTDVSRRVISASGSIVAAARPFEVDVWSRRGFVAAGENVPLTVTARRVGGGMVGGRAEVRLERLRRDGTDVVTDVVETKSVDLVDGTAEVALPVVEAGLYRAVASVTEDGVTLEGRWEFLARGESNDVVPQEPLTLTPDKREYQVGDTARLLVTAAQAGTQVLVMNRPEQGRYNDYQVKLLSDRAWLIEVPVGQADMPNIFFEALAVVDGDLETAVAELFVPPATRPLNVALEVSDAEVLPGGQVVLNLSATDDEGRPYAGSVAVSVYDRSLEALAGRPDSGDIRQAFWSWRRNHYVSQSDSLGRVFSEFLKRGETRLTPLGRFGGYSDVIASLSGGGGIGGGGLELRTKHTAGALMERGRASGSMPKPASAPMMEADSFAVETAADKLDDEEAAGSGQAESPVAVRESFADTAFWTGVARTNADGTAQFTVMMPENLTAWSANAWVVAHGTRVGQASTGIVTTKDLLVRMIAPRFLVQTDEVVLSGVVQNKTDDDVEAKVSLAVNAEVLQLADASPQLVRVPAHGTARVDWKAHAVSEGTAEMVLTARSSAGDDAMKITAPVKVHGFLRTQSWAGVLRDEASRTITVQVPEDRRPEQSLLSVRVSPTVAGAIVESLPYLIDYPYGCTEQTLNRFLPAVVTRKTLADLNLSLEEVAGLTAKLDPNVPERTLDGSPDAVLSDAKLDDVVDAGVKRLLEMQLSDGGWGWFSGYQEKSYPHTTAVVVRGLTRARGAGVDLPEAALQRGLAWLDQYRARQIELLKNAEQKREDLRRKRAADHLDAMVEMTLSEAGRPNTEMQRFLVRDRLELSPLGLAMVGLALAADQESESDETLRTVVSNLEQFFIADDENATAYLKTPNRFGYWRWYGDDVEANAYALKLFLKALPNDPRVSGLARYLLNNRRNATYWKSTRDTAIAVEALCDYLGASGELDADVTFEVVIDGRSQREIHVTRENLFSFDGVVELRGESLAAGPHTIELRSAGRGPLYYAVQQTDFSLETFIERTGLELRTERRYWKLTPRDQSTTAAGARGNVVNMDVAAFDRTPLAQNEELPTGTLVEVEILVESKNDYEYLMLEDPKAAGFEAVESQSGYRRGFGGAYVEFRDDRVVMFFRQIRRGTTSATYRVRTEQPGRFSALPARIEAMYSPSLVGNSNEQKVVVLEVDD